VCAQVCARRKKKGFEVYGSPFKECSRDLDIHVHTFGDVNFGGWIRASQPFTLLLARDPSDEGARLREAWVCHRKDFNGTNVMLGVRWGYLSTGALLIRPLGTTRSLRKQPDETGFIRHRAAGGGNSGMGYHEANSS
jgi:hypothetical protein